MHATLRCGAPSLMSLPKDSDIELQGQASEITHPEFDLTRPSLISVT